MNDEGRITAFTEKPKTDEDIAGFESSVAGTEKPYMASMGIYIFSTERLVDILTENPGTDFGKHIIPAAIETCRVMGYPFNHYWEDIGTMKRFYEVNLDMAAPLPKFNLYDPRRPIFTRPRFLPGSKVEGGSLHNVLLADGGRIQEATIRDSVIGLRSIIGARVTIQRTVMMGADYYETSSETVENERLGRPNIGIGSGTVIEGAIIDKNARIGSQVIIRHFPDREDTENDHWISREGIVIVPKNAIVADGAII
jgi:glucose-1-phosphate adenylyltransferase